MYLVFGDMYSEEVLAGMSKNSVFFLRFLGDAGRRVRGDHPRAAADPRSDTLFRGESEDHP